MDLSPRPRRPNSARPLVEDPVRGAWLRFVRRLRANQALLGETTDLTEFMFGSERTDLSTYVAILQEVQSGACFYCLGRLSGSRGVVATSSRGRRTRSISP